MKISINNLEGLSTQSVAMVPHGLFQQAFDQLLTTQMFSARVIQMAPSIGQIVLSTGDALRTPPSRQATSLISSWNWSPRDNRRVFHSSNSLVPCSRSVCHS
ncbi:hypothetical protein O181_059851 [Austropuccinia psidii MF-1]|uniref:Uncharacterized protein n=1 Tax=Austropuccinia psidii MF-1 TaxID=1389203 RepID=A0A9Q3HW19_9BASI|nr:hypothetical protein [Austropuccinia psidii MF-1]